MSYKSKPWLGGIDDSKTDSNLKGNINNKIGIYYFPLNSYCKNCFSKGVSSLLKNCLRRELVGQQLVYLLHKAGY